MGDWIKCSDWMPENSKDVTVFSEQFGVVNGYYRSGTHWGGHVEPKWFVCCGEHECSAYDITHWQPLPPPPEEA